MNNEEYSKEFIENEVAKINALQEAGELPPRPTLESLQGQLINGEITQEEFDQQVEFYELTKESTEERVQELRERRSWFDNT
jgi:hypothetical protein